MENLIFKRKTRGKNKVLRFLLLIILSVFILLLLYYFDVKIRGYDSMRSSIVAFVIFFWLMLTEFILAKYKINEDELRITDSLHPFGKKIKIEQIESIKEISGLLSKKKEGLSIKTYSGRSYQIFPEDKNGFISAMLSKNDKIKKLN